MLEILPAEFIEAYYPRVLPCMATIFFQIWNFNVVFFKEENNFLAITCTFFDHFSILLLVVFDVLEKSRNPR